MLCLALGVNAIVKNEAAFSNKFSTVLRSTGNPALNTIVNAEQHSGCDPLPRHLALSSVQYRETANKMSGFDLVNGGLSDRGKVYWSLAAAD